MGHGVMYVEWRPFAYSNIIFAIDVGQPLWIISASVLVSVQCASCLLSDVRLDQTQIFLAYAHAHTHSVGPSCAQSCLFQPAASLQGSESKLFPTSATFFCSNRYPGPNPETWNQQPISPPHRQTLFLPLGYFVLILQIRMAFYDLLKTCFQHFRIPFR